MKKGVQKIYAEVFHAYELVNHVLTWGLDITWRKKAARLATRAHGSHWLDICSGTGEMAQHLSQYTNRKTRIVALDFSFPMLAQVRRKKEGKNIKLCIGDAGCLPFPDNSFDLITISFATRNINPNKKRLTAYIKEFCRVTKTGGHFLHLETSQPKSSILRRLFHHYIKFVVKPVGTFLSGSKAGYKYLSYTIPRFYSPEDFTEIMQEAGFKQVKLYKLLFGVAAIHNGKKL